MSANSTTAKTRQPVKKWANGQRVSEEKIQMANIYIQKILLGKREM